MIQTQTDKGHCHSHHLALRPVLQGGAGQIGGELAGGVVGSSMQLAGLVIGPI